jgi:ABC-2 type transport system permease protein
VKKKSFLIMTVLGPLLMGGIFTSAFLLDKVDSEVKTIAVVDDTHLFKDKFKDNDRIKFVYPSGGLDSVKVESDARGYFGVLYIPPTSNLSLLEKAVTIYSSSQPGFEVISKIKFTLEKEINTYKYVEAGIDEKKLDSIKTEVDIKTKDLNNKETSTPLTSYLGFIGGFMIYLFIFIYGAMVMRGVLEEKTSRIVEVIISSIKPFQLMMGKIFGVALVALTQLVLWIILSTVVYNGVSSALNKDSHEQLPVMMQQKLNIGDEEGSSEIAHFREKENTPKLTEILGSINLPVILGMFIFYFLGGYLLYSALFAAIGAAVDSETDTQ